MATALIVARSTKLRHSDLIISPPVALNSQNDCSLRHWFQQADVDKRLVPHEKNDKVSHSRPAQSFKYIELSNTLRSKSLNLLLEMVDLSDGSRSTSAISAFWVETGTRCLGKAIDCCVGRKWHLKCSPDVHSINQTKSSSSTDLTTRFLSIVLTRSCLKLTERAVPKHMRSSAYPTHHSVFYFVLHFCKSIDKSVRFVHSTQLDYSSLFDSFSWCVCLFNSLTGPCAYEWMVKPQNGWLTSHECSRLLFFNRITPLLTFTIHQLALLVIYQICRWHCPLPQIVLVNDYFEWFSNNLASIHEFSVQPGSLVNTSQFCDCLYAFSTSICLSIWTIFHQLRTIYERRLW